MADHHKQGLTLKYLGINTSQEAIVYMRSDCHICQSEGFEVPTRIQVRLGEHSLIATLNLIDGDLLPEGVASLSTFAWQQLKAKEGDKIHLSHPTPLESLSLIHRKIYGQALTMPEMRMIVNNVLSRELSDIQIGAFLTACAARQLNNAEMLALTRAMIDTGESLLWPSQIVVDKHCIGGLPGNRTTLIVVPIVAAFGLMIPKTSSRAITSPAGTADTMEVLAPVNLDLKQMRKVVEEEGGCIVWGDAVSLSPADDALIRIERVLDLDSQSQIVASILSKKIASGSTHVVVDIPIGATAKVRSIAEGMQLKESLEKVGEQLGIKVKAVLTDGEQPVGEGIGPALEARDVLRVLQGTPDAPQDLRERALTLAGIILEFLPTTPPGTGKALAETLLNNGSAWKKFQAICQAQGGMKELPIATFKHTAHAAHSGIIKTIDNRLLAKVAKLAGAPSAKAAGIDLHAKLNVSVKKGDPLFTIHAISTGQLSYALNFLHTKKHVFEIGEME